MSTVWSFALVSKLLRVIFSTPDVLTADIVARAAVVAVPAAARAPASRARAARAAASRPRATRAAAAAARVRAAARAAQPGRRNDAC